MKYNGRADSRTPPHATTTLALGKDTLQEVPAVYDAVAAVIIQQGRLLGFIDGRTQREETPEEYVR